MSKTDRVAMMYGGPTARRPFARLRRRTDLRRALTTLGRLCVLGAMAGLAIGCETSEVRTDRLTRFVEEISFGSPLDPDAKPNVRLNRWSGNMRVVVSGPGNGNGDRQQQVMAALQRMSRAIGLDARLAEEGAQHNVMVVFVESPDFLVKRERVPCFATTRRERGREHLIVEAEIKISLEEPELIDECLYHEFMHALGFGYHSAVLRSVLSPAHQPGSLTTWDELALKVLYDPRLEPGLTREQALPTMRAIVSELVGTS